MAQINCWLASSLERVFPQSCSAVPLDSPTRVLAGEVFSFQIVCRPQERTTVTVNFEGTFTEVCEVRKVELVPVFHATLGMPAELTETQVPGLIPDLLRPGVSFALDPGYAQSLWVTVRVPRSAEAGEQVLGVSVRSDSEMVWSAEVSFKVLPLEQPAIPQIPVSHWFYCDSLLEWYGLQPWEERFWAVAEAYLKNVTDHGQNMVLTPTITPSADAEKRPHQLVAITEPNIGQFAFDFSDLERWIRLCLQCGFQHFEIAHLATQWGASWAPAIYVQDRFRKRRLFSKTTPSTSPEYRNFLAQYLPALVACLERQGVRDRSYFHISDEPSLGALDKYRAMREMVREFAPDMQTLDSLSDFEFIEEGVVDLPVPKTHAAPRIRAKTEKPVWTYFCCGPGGRFINRALDSPLYKFRLLGWLMYCRRLNGFLHWSYNYWFEFTSTGDPFVSGTGPLLDPFLHTDGLAYPTLPSGECFLVYPGPAGPLDSLRWEIFRESMQDHALLGLTEKTLGVVELPELVDFENYPSSPSWLLSKRQEILRLLEESL